METLRIILARLALGVLLPALLSAEGKKTIMPLGDSITKGDGCEGTSSYRKFLADSLNGHRFEFDFVGSKTCAENLGYDSDHQGMAGWTTWNILNGYPGDTSGNLREWAPRYKPDIVLIHLGTNDVAQNVSPGHVTKNLSEIARILSAANPNVRIYVAKILPMQSRWGMRTRALILNDSISVWAWRQGALLVDQYDGIVPSKDLYDGVHPNQTGYSKMAGRWFAAIRGEFDPDVPLLSPSRPVLHGSVWRVDGRAGRGRTPIPLFSLP